MVHEKPIEIWEWEDEWGERASVPLRACVSALLCLGLRLRLLPWAISPLRSLRGEFKRGRPTCGKGGGFLSPRRLAVSRVSDAIDASGQMRHSDSHPLSQRDAPPLASSQRPTLVASPRNAPLQQSQRERVAPLPLVTSQREGVAPLQQP
ncbi:hypothetical protein B296_00056577 [Ensete ventricosum]|uniref:Uncharacterized protein n=1 Tax=Ensete ventricosum TaxID=4639 RepID=A0A426WXR8_ENSVE|nr:hypothetical protein B296_00056577 [Ensete ventricosum]